MFGRPSRRSGPVLRGCLAVVAYTYAGYPLLVAARALLVPRPWAVGEPAASCSVIVAAHDEEAVIVEKLRTLARSIGDRADVEVVVADDGSTDRTAELAESSGLAHRVLRLPRGGKAAALSAAVAASSGDILVFTDANSLFEERTLGALLAPFADPEVGGVAGDQRYIGDGGSAGERAHWSFDRWLKRAEAAAGSTVSATGALYAIRRRHFHGVREGVTDDFYLSTGVVADGARLVFAPDATVVEQAAETARQEYGRKVRVMTRGLAAVRARAELLAPRHGFYALSLLSRKVLRRLSAIPLLVAGVSAVLQPRRSLLTSAVAATTWTTVGLGVVGLAGPPVLARRRAFSVPAFVCLSVGAAVRALWNTARGVRIERWEASDGAHRSRRR